MRIATGGIAQETNTFQRELTTLADFQRPGFGTIVRGQQLLDLEGTGTVYGGAVAEAKRLDVELIPTTYDSVMPGGRVTREAFDTLRDEIVAGIRAALPVDGVLLDLHGAMALENDDDGETLLIQAVREVVGPSMPIVAPLDLHTNLSDDMVAGVNAFVGYKEYPHVDMPETGARALQILVASIQHGTRLAMAYTRLPLIVPNQAMVTTWASPLKITIDRAREIEREPGVLAATVLGGFPFADVPFAGVATIMVTEDDPALARRYADELAAICWAQRDDFTIRPTPVAEPITEAMTAPAGSVYVLADIADSGASGTAGDGTVVPRFARHGCPLGRRRPDHGSRGRRGLRSGRRGQHGHPQRRRPARPAARPTSRSDGNRPPDSPGEFPPGRPDGCRDDRQSRPHRRP